MSHALRTALMTAPQCPAAIPTEVPNKIDTFMWQADPRSLRLTFVSGQVGRILGAPARHWIDDRHPWRSIAGPERHRVELALHRAVRIDGDGEVEFTAVDATGRAFVARLVIRVARPIGAPVRLWGLMTDTWREPRDSVVRLESVAKPLVAPPILRRAGRLVTVAIAATFASYALAVSAIRPASGEPPMAVAIQRADQLEEALQEHADEEALLEDAVGSIESSVEEIVALGDLASKLGALQELRAKIAELITLTPPDLAGRLRALLVELDRVTKRTPLTPPPLTPPEAPGHDVDSQPGGATDAGTAPGNAPPAPAPTGAPSDVPNADVAKLPD